MSKTKLAFTNTVFFERDGKSVDWIDEVEYRLSAIENEVAGLLGVTDNLQLWKENIQSRLNALEARSKLANCVDVEEFYKDDEPAPIQSSEIRPEDTLTASEQKDVRDYIRYRLGEGTFDGNKMPFWLVDIEEKLAELAKLKAYSSEIRIRPEDMVMVKYSDENEPMLRKLNDINLSRRNPNVYVEYISPIQPVRREWNERMLVWRARPMDDNSWWKIDKVYMTHVTPSDLWLPVLSPDEPAPEGPEVG